MLSRFFLLFIATGLLLSSSANAQANKTKSYKPNQGAYPKWVKIGEKTVSRVEEFDEFAIGGNGIYSALKLRVTKADVEFDKMVVIYESGQMQEFSLRKVIRENQESRVIDLPGNKRLIRSIRFRYETKGLFNGRARVQVWGRK